MKIRCAVKICTVKARLTDVVAEDKDLLIQSHCIIAIKLVFFQNENWRFL